MRFSYPLWVNAVARRELNPRCDCDVDDFSFYADLGMPEMRIKGWLPYWSSSFNCILSCLFLSTLVIIVCDISSRSTDSLTTAFRSYFLNFIGWYATGSEHILRLVSLLFWTAIKIGVCFKLLHAVLSTCSWRRLHYW